MSIYKPFNPVVEAQTIPIEVAIRLERNKLFDLEFETGEKQSDAYLVYLQNERQRGITKVVVNF